MKIHYWVAKMFWIAIGMYVCIHAYVLGLGRFQGPGPGFIFFLAALLLIILGFIDLVGGFTGRSRTDKEEEYIWFDVRWPKLISVLGVLIAYVFCLDVLGFVLSTFLLMVFLFKTVEPTKWPVAIVEAVTTILATHYIFRVWLRIPFPKGLLGF